MIGIESISRVLDSESIDNIKEMTQCFVSHVRPLKVILFGSFASGSYTEDSDFDFYIVVDDSRNVNEAIDEAYNSVLFVKKRPVDIVVGTNSHFDRKGNSKYSLMVEKEVQRKGILLYDRSVNAVEKVGYE